jgi:F-type H+-transporting ATPase subunit epsilon
MDPKPFKFEIVTPLKITFSGEIWSAKAPGISGYFGVLHNHAPFLTALQIGAIRVITEKGEKVFATSGGFAEVINNKMTILAESAEEAAQIDVERAKQARDRALKRLLEKNRDTDFDRAHLALLRALNRLSVAGQN